MCPIKRVLFAYSVIYPLKKFKKVVSKYLTYNGFITEGLQQDYHMTLDKSGMKDLESNLEKILQPDHCSTVGSAGKLLYTKSSF